MSARQDAPREVRGRRGRRGGGAATLLLLLLLCSACAHSLPDKRAEMSPVPFVMGSRYGRSSPLRSMSPRNDRFFMSGRYGKRSEPPSPPEAPAGDAAGGGGRALLCRYTGVYPLYRCLPGARRIGLHRRKAADDPGPGERL